MSRYWEGVILSWNLGAVSTVPQHAPGSGCHQGVLFRWAQQTGAIGSGFAKHQEINDDWPQV